VDDVARRPTVAVDQLAELAPAKYIGCFGSSAVDIGRSRRAGN